MSTRTNIVLDDELIAKAMARAGVTTKKAAVEAALRAYVRKPDYSGLLALAGTGVLADDYDPKALFTQARGEDEHAVMEPVASYRVTAPRQAGKKPAKALAKALAKAPASGTSKTAHRTTGTSKRAA